MSYVRLRQHDGEAWRHFPNCGLVEAAERYATEVYERSGVDKLRLEVTHDDDEIKKVFRMRTTVTVTARASIVLTDEEQKAIQVTKDTAKQSGDKARQAFDERVVAELKGIRDAIAGSGMIRLE